MNNLSNGERYQEYWNSMEKMSAWVGDAYPDSELRFIVSNIYKQFGEEVVGFIERYGKLLHQSKNPDALALHRKLAKELPKDAVDGIYFLDKKSLHAMTREIVLHYYHDVIDQFILKDSKDSSDNLRIETISRWEGFIEGEFFTKRILNSYFARSVKINIENAEDLIAVENSEITLSDVEKVATDIQRLIITALLQQFLSPETLFLETSLKITVIVLFAALQIYKREPIPINERLLYQVTKRRALNRTSNKKEKELHYFENIICNPESFKFAISGLVKDKRVKADGNEWDSENITETYVQKEIRFPWQKKLDTSDLQDLILLLLSIDDGGRKRNRKFKRTEKDIFDKLKFALSNQKRVERNYGILAGKRDLLWINPIDGIWIGTKK